MPSGGARRRLKSSFIHEAAAAANTYGGNPLPQRQSPYSKIFKTAFCFEFRKVVGHCVVQNSKSLSLVCMNGDVCVFWY